MVIAVGRISSQLGIQSDRRCAHCSSGYLDQETHSNSYPTTREMPPPYEGFDNLIAQHKRGALLSN